MDFFCAAALMTLLSWTSFQSAVDSGNLLSLSGATTFFNIFQALTGNKNLDQSDNVHMFGIVVNLLITLLLMTVAGKVFYFVTEMWPLWVLGQFRKYVGLHAAENAAVVDVFQEQPEEYVFDNELLVVALERYVSYVLHMREQRLPGDAITDNTIHNSLSLRSSSLLRLAEYRYLPVAVPERGGHKDVVGTLQRYYRLVTLPADGQAVEVEPGLTVCFQEQIVSVSALKRNKIISRCGEQMAMRDFIPLNFDGSPAERDPKNLGNGKDDDHVVHGADSDDDEAEFEDQFAGPGTNQRRKKVLVRQAILRCIDKGKDKRDCIMDFARRAYAWYYPTVVEPVERYYFIPSCSEFQKAVGIEGSESFEVSLRLHMHRFPLCRNRPGFRTLFFPQKSQLLNLLEDFKQRRGKFALPGVPQQLVILLHGKPGTGKTSVVRSIASFLDRHIVAIPITFIQTNGALQEILSGGTVILHRKKGVECFSDGFTDMSDTTVSVPLIYELSVDQVLYVFEDIEVVSDMVSFRSSFRQSPHVFSKTTEMGPHTGEREERETKDSAFVASSSECKCGSENKELEKGIEEEISCMDSSRLYQKLPLNDFLSPEGLRRAIDGTFAPSGRVMVFTTNHLEKLPPVFWQPGVLTLAVPLGNLNKASAMELVAHYCPGSISPPLRARFEAFFAQCEARSLTNIMNPASLEHMLMVYEDAEELIQALECQCEC